MLNRTEYNLKNKSCRDGVVVERSEYRYLVSRPLITKNYVAGHC